MIKKIIDAHIHLELYHEVEQQMILKSMAQDGIVGLITISNHLESAKRNLNLSKQDPRVFSAFGFHPEQALPAEKEVEELLHFIYTNEQDMIAVGEVGLPYYLRKNDKSIPLEPYIELLERFLITAKKLDKPVLLHAIYEDAATVCSMLEEQEIEKAHFHWFKGDFKTVGRIAQNGYYISVTPDILYEKEIQEIVKEFPLEQLMVETDGPWPFEGPFKQQITHPKMMHDSVKVIAELKRRNLYTVYDTIYKNTLKFMNL